MRSLEKVIEKKLSLGVYPKVSKEQAGEKRNEARKLLEQDQDPAHVKKMQKRDRRRAIGQTFKEVALEWHKVKKPSWSESHGKRLDKINFRKSRLFFISKNVLLIGGRVT